MAWAPDYLTLAALKAYLRIPLADTTDDVELAVANSAMSRAIDGSCNRQFGSAAGTRAYTAWFNPETGRWVIDVDDLAVAPTSIAIVDTTGGGAADRPITAYDHGPANAVADGKVWTRITVRPSSAVQPSGAQAECSIAANPWGWPAVPPAVTMAARMQANRFSNRRESPYGVAGSPSDGSELRLLAKLDPDVAVSLSGYVREGVVA